MRPDATPRERDLAQFYARHYGKPVSDVFCSFSVTYVAFEDGQTLTIDDSDR